MCLSNRNAKGFFWEKTGLETLNPSADRVFLNFIYEIFLAVLEGHQSSTSQRSW